MKILLCLAAGWATLATTATAQRVPVQDRPSVFKPSGPKAGAKDTRRVVQKFANCLAKRSMSGVAQFLDEKMDRLSPALRSRASDCLGESIDSDESALKGQTDTYRYALAEAYVVRKYGDAGVADLSYIAPLEHPGEGPESNRHGLGMLSECIIRKSPGESWNLLRTDAASVEEKTAFAALSPAMQSCVRRGTTMKMPAFFVRGAIAQTYYMISLAPRIAPGSAK